MYLLFFQKKQDSMKARFTENSIRLRVRKSDVDQLASSGSVSTALNFPNSSLRFQLQLEAVEEPSTWFDGATLNVSLPMVTGRKWIESDQVGIEHHQASEGGSPLHILVEKDFPCAHQPQEDKSDTFEELSEQ